MANFTLNDVGLFGGLDENECAQLADLMTSHSYAKGAIIVQTNDPGDALYVVKEGKVKVSLLGKNGKELILDFLESGEFFGEMSLVDGEPRSANIICMKKCTVLRLGRKEFLKALRSFPSMSLNIMTELCIRLRKADSTLGSLALLDVFGRVARYILEKAEEEGEDHDEGLLIDKLPSQQEIARRLGTSRETVSRALSEFHKRGWLDTHGKGVLVRPELDHNYRY